MPYSSSCHHSMLHKGLWAVMQSYGMDQKLTRLIQAIYSETQLAVLVNGHLSERFQMTVGNRQGGPLSPRSFALFLERTMDKIKNRENSGESVRGNRVNNLRFADDIDIIEQSNEKLQDTLHKLHTESEQYGMHINVVKTKTMVYGKKARRE